MTDQRARAVERAEQVIRDVHKDLPDIWLGGRQRYVLVEAIATALADERRRVLDEIGDQLDQLGDWYFDEGNTQARLAVEKVERFLNEYAKAHAGQEG